MRRLLAVLVGFGLALLSSGPALGDVPGADTAACPVDQSFESDDIHTDYAWTPYAYRNGVALGGVTVALAQTFTVGRTGNLVRVTVRVGGTDLIGDLPLEIRRGGPDGSLAASATMAQADVASPGWLDVPLDPAPLVHAGEVLAIVLPPLQPRYDANLASKQPIIVWVSSWETPGYPGGGAFAGSRSGRDGGPVGWDQFGLDRHFRTSVCSLPPTDTELASDPTDRAPQPGAWLLVAAAAAAGLLASLRRGQRVVEPRP